MLIIKDLEWAFDSPGLLEQPLVRSRAPAQGLPWPAARADALLTVRRLLAKDETTL